MLLMLSTAVRFRSSMKKTKKEKQVNKTGRALWFMLLLLIPVFLILFLLSTHFAQKRESEQEYARRSILVNITENEQQRNEAAEKQFDEKLSVLLQLMTDSLKEYVTEEGYTGPRVFDHGFVAELKDGQLVIPDGIPGGEMQLTPELVEEGISSEKMRTGRLLSAKDVPYFLSFGKIADNLIYVELTEEEEYAEYMRLYTAQSDSVIESAVDVTGGFALFFTQQDEKIELVKLYGESNGADVMSGISEDVLLRRESEITLDGVKYSCSYTALPAAGSYGEGLTMVHMLPQHSFREQNLLQSAGLCFAMLLVFITAIVYLSSIRNYVRENVLNEEQAQQYRPKKIRRRIRNSGFVGALAIFAVAMVLQITNQITLEIRYGRDALNAVSDQLGQYELEQEKEIEQREADWYVRYGNQVASLLSECPQLAVADKLQEFCDILNIDYIMLFDASGRETLCSKDYIGFTLDEDLGENSADFRRLLQGVPSVIHEPASDNTTGLERQMIGVKMPDTKRQGRYGALIMALMPEQIESAGKITDPNSQMKLMVTEGSVCFAADNSTGEVFLSSDSAMIGKTVTSLGLPEESLDTGYMDFSRLEGTRCYVITKSYNDLTFYYAVKTEVMFQNDFLYAAVCALLFVLAFAIVMGYLLKDYDDKTFEEWSAISLPADESPLREAAEKRKELKAAVKDKQGADRLNAYWQKFLQLLHWDEKLPGEKAGLLFNTGLFILLLFWLFLLFRKNVVYGEYNSLAGFLLRGDWRRGLTLFCIGGILLVVTDAFFIYVLCMWLLLLIATVVPGKGETICRLLTSVVKYVSFFAVLYFSLGYLGFPVSTIVASLGIVSLALSLGAQDLVADIIAGLFIVFEGSFHVGDYITIDGTRGMVREIGVRSTKLITPVDNLMIINNHKIDSIVNLSKKASTYLLNINIPADIPLQRVEELLQRELPALGVKSDLIIGAPYYLGVMGLGSAVTFGKPCKTLSIGTDCLEKDIEDVELFINREVALLFERENIPLI